MVQTGHLGDTVPRGGVHRTVARAKTITLMVEATTVTPTGDGFAEPSGG